MGDQSLSMNEHLTFNHGGQQVHLFLTEEKEWQRYDTAGQYSMTFGAKEYDDVVVKDSSVDFVLIREELGEPFRLEVNAAKFTITIIVQWEMSSLSREISFILPG